MSKYIMRTSCPGNYDKNFMVTNSNGWNTCIVGNPTKKDANALANCVGYASGRFNEIINQIRDTIGCTYRTLNCNAENFVERAEKAGLQVGNEPRIGAIMCWQKGSLSSSNGAGHVAIVEKVIDKDTVYTSESSYGGTYFFNATRKRKSGNGWGIGGDYKFRGFIYLPEDVQKEIDGVEITPNVDRDENKNQIEVKINDLRVREDAGTDKEVLGYASKGFYNYYETKEANGYTWYRIADNQWIASREDWTTILPATKPEPTPTPTPTEIELGDTVIVNGFGTAASTGEGARTRNFVNQKMKVIMISGNTSRPNRYALNQYNKGNINDPRAVTGWFSINSITK